MLQKSLKRGFTLIELLVVITIIGILATGAVTVYTSQIQKARDTTRIKDINALRGAVEQAYQDDTTYPDGTEVIANLQEYLPRMPKDNKHGQTCNAASGTTAICAYAYRSGDDANGITDGAFEVSTAFENASNRTGKGTGEDSGAQVDDNRIELGTQLGVIDTSVSAAITIQSGSCTTAGAAGAATDKVVINGNPAANPECG